MNPESSRAVGPPEVRTIRRRAETVYGAFVAGCLLICALVVLAMLGNWRS